MVVEVCLPLYKRNYRIPILMKQLKDQTCQDFMLNIWNNSNEWIDTRNFTPKRVRIFQGSGNEGSATRFKLVLKVKGNPIIFIDDDFVLDPDFVEYYLEQYKKYGKDCILGWWSKIWKVENYHSPIAKLPEGEEVDYIGTGGMILDREIFDKELSLQNIPPEFVKVEDLYLSYIARQKYGMKLISLKKKCSIKQDGYDQTYSLKKYKQEAFLKLRGMGWKLLYL